MCGQVSVVEEEDDSRFSLDMDLVVFCTITMYFSIGAPLELAGYSASVSWPFGAREMTGLTLLL